MLRTPQTKVRQLILPSHFVAVTVWVESFRLLPGDEVIVRRATAPVRIVKFDDKNYYHTLKNKLWRNG